LTVVLPREQALAQVICHDASPGVLAIARQRLPAADVRESELEALTFADASFNVVMTVSSIFYAEDMARRAQARIFRTV